MNLLKNPYKSYLRLRYLPSLRSFSSFVSQNGVTIETNELAELMNPSNPDYERLAIFNATINRRDYVPKDDHI